MSWRRYLRRTSFYERRSNLLWSSKRPRARCVRFVMKKDYTEAWWDRSRWSWMVCRERTEI
uniref:Uncharacterized protein n=1 Tax=Brassica campestris TaxID=3711 RepID=A0A3P6BCS7_BRACM|nr:unnamed protein product [Brassica rapa]